MGDRKCRQPGPLRCEANDFYRPGASLPPQTPGVKGRNDNADPNALLRQVKALTRKQEQLRKSTHWANVFFKNNPDIPTIASSLSVFVDLSIQASNRYPDALGRRAPAGFAWVQSYRSRSKIDQHTASILKRYHAPQHIQYRIPRAWATALQMAKSAYGKCEEHAFYALYLLTIGHMAQGMPFGRVKRDIYYTGAGMSDHAMVILVKGTEFKDLLKKKMGPNGRVDIPWLLKNTNSWGKSAWVIDGWDSRNCKNLAQAKIKLDFKKSLAFRRSQPSSVPSEWDLHLIAMIKRVAKDYKL